MGERLSNDHDDAGLRVDEPSDHEASLHSKGPLPDESRAMPTGTSETYRSSGREAALSRTIENEIIPRLLLAHRPAKTRSTVSSDLGLASGEIADLVTIVTRDSYAKARDFIEATLARGVSVEAVIGDVLPAAARHVGWMWETDACTFVDVTFALSRLQQLLRHYAPSLERVLNAPAQGRRVLLSTMPGEQHTFGASVFEEFLIGAAWDVVPDTPANPGVLLKRVARGFFDIVGLSASTDGALRTMAALIVDIRAASSNRSVRVIIGGAAVQRCPELASIVGADAVACDPASAIGQMEAMMGSLLRPC